MTTRVESKLYPGCYYEWDWDFGELLRIKSGPDGGIMEAICVHPPYGTIHGDTIMDDDTEIVWAETVLAWCRLDEQYVLSTGNRM